MKIELSANELYIIENALTDRMTHCLDKQNTSELKYILDYWNDEFKKVLKVKEKISKIKGENIDESNTDFKR